MLHPPRKLNAVLKGAAVVPLEMNLVAPLSRWCYGHQSPHCCIPFCWLPFLALSIHNSKHAAKSFTLGFFTARMQGTIASGPLKPLERQPYIRMLPLWYWFSDRKGSMVYKFRGFIFLGSLAWLFFSCANKGHPLSLDATRNDCGKEAFPCCCWNMVLLKYVKTWYCFNVNETSQAYQPL